MTISGIPQNLRISTLAVRSVSSGLVYSSSGVFGSRTLTGTTGQITVTNGDGVSGNPTISLPATLTQAQTFSAITTVSNTTQTTSTTDGAFVCAGGGAFAKALHVGSYMSLGRSSVDANYIVDAYKSHNGNTIMRVLNDNTSSNASSRLIVGNDTSANMFQFQLNSSTNTTLSGANSINFYYAGDSLMAFYTQATVRLTIDNTTNEGVVSILSTQNATTGGAGALRCAGGIYAAAKIICGSTITSQAGIEWNLGAASVVSPTSPNRTITVTVAGVTYYLAAKTTND